MGTARLSNAAEVVKNAVDESRILLLHRPVALDCICNDGSLLSVSDPNHLRLIASNLLNNAIRLTPRGRITMILGHEGNCLKLTVTDTGTGISRKALANWNSGHSRDFSRTAKAIGIELVMTRKLVELLGGHIVVSSRPDSGTIVEVWIPLIEYHRKELAAIPLEMSVCSA